MSRTTSESTLPRQAVLAIIGGQAIAFFAIGVVLWYFSGRPLDTFLVFDIDGAIAGIALGAALSAVAAICFLGFTRLTDPLVELQAEGYGIFGRDKPLSLSTIIAISLCAGIGEEALFRGGLQTLIGDYTGPGLAIAISSALFAALHIPKPIIAVLVFSIGAIFGVVYWQTGSLLAVMVGHALYDVFALWYVQKRVIELGIAKQDGGSEHD